MIVIYIYKNKKLVIVSDTPVTVKAHAHLVIVLNTIGVTDTKLTILNVLSLIFPKIPPAHSVKLQVAA